MKKFKLQLDTESINLENEIHSNNFPFKVKSLAEHCVKYILGTENTNDCNNIKYNKEVHDQELFPISDNVEDKVNEQTIIAQIFQFKEHSFKNTTRKFLF